MAIDATVDPLGYLEEAATKPEKPTGTFTPFFFAIADGEKALIRPLLNLVTDNQVGLVVVYKHEYFDNATKKYVLRSMCARMLDLECQCCKDVEAMPETTKDEKAAKRKSAAMTGEDKDSSRRFVLPVYLHAVINKSTGKQVTYKNQEQQEIPKSGPVLLEMKPDFSDIFHDLLKTYQASESHDITKRDFKIERSTVNGFPVYTTTPMDISPFDPASFDIPAEWLNKESVFDLYQEACPPKIVGEEVTPATAKATNGTVKSVPDF